MTDVAKASGTHADEKKKYVNTISQARWLARQEIKRTWLSYLATGTFFLLFGLFALTYLGQLFDGEASSSMTFSSNVFFLAIISALAVNSLSKDYLYSWGRDNFSDRLTFLRSLPISNREMVLNRLLTLLVALLVNTVLFFLPPYLLSETLRAGLGPTQYLWFIVMWASYALLGAGFYIYMEFSASGKTYNITMLLMLVPIIVIGGTAALIFGVSFLSSVAELVLSYGPLLAMPVFLLGIIWLLVCCWVTVRRVEKRDLKEMSG